MRPSIAHLLTCLYPRRWRERYGAEFTAFLETVDQQPTNNRRPHRPLPAFSIAADILATAIKEHIHPTGGRSMRASLHPLVVMMKRPSAFLPPVMSLIAAGMVLGNVALYGAGPRSDEGATAHLWQLLMALQLPMIAVFAIKWLPRAPRPTLYVLAQQAAAVLASCATVFFFNLG